MIDRVADDMGQRIADHFDHLAIQIVISDSGDLFPTDAEHFG